MTVGVTEKVVRTQHLLITDTIRPWRISRLLDTICTSKLYITNFDDSKIPTDNRIMFGLTMWIRQQGITI